MRRSRWTLWTIALAAFLAATGCTEKNMGSAGNDGWTKVDTHAGKSSAPPAPLAHAAAVNVTYYYLPG